MRHIPVLAKEILENLSEDMSVFMDGTIGHGGHIEYFFSNGNFDNTLFVAVDRDAQMLKKAKSYLTSFGDKIIFQNNNYSDLENISKNIGDKKFDGILLDLGVNMDHFKLSDRGFSIKKDGNLDMRFDSSSQYSAYDFLNNGNRSDISQAFNKYGDFTTKFADYMADCIIGERKKSKLSTTFDFVNLLKNIGLGTKKISVVFQCVRIVVNNELGHLEKFLDNFGSYLNSGGKCFIITYHSIEDRIVKYKFKDKSRIGNFQLINKKVIKPSYQEIQKNNASRSAKLRIIKAL
ncbi:16S rRNA (cytosine(1402)-N(4))-methyltransferase RsmH [Candidatus Vampirococcus lugosii]|uniref:Ribosomal RNA small subunit methyltransferase H n=1 Tax=Candidatus Vampirococcus lugosii TaxID=2789015 RepID=A0ABS5QM06_9BACT|nr:16S rRNA (cytosine(1402)-N(4))-methyltransferase RsmH [Candidatus Vampirococcus lugosii]MBS8121808.1 16S rRNA methyltransferase [Candidatus Vampirococcus lugosii]